MKIKKVDASNVNLEMYYQSVKEQKVRRNLNYGSINIMTDGDL